MSSVSHAELLLRAAARQHELVHAGAVEGDRQVLGDPLLGQARLQVVGVQHRDLRRVLEPVRRRASGCRRRSARTRRSCPGSRAACRSTWAGRGRARSGPRRCRRRGAAPAGVGRNGSIRSEHGDRPGPRAAAAVRLGEGLVQVVVDDVEAHVAGPRDAHDRVQVGAVVVERGPRLVHDPRDLLDVAVEQAERVGVGQHQAGDVVGRLGAQVVEVHAAVLGRADLDDLVARHRHRRRVGAVRGVRREHLGLLLAAVLVVGAREQQAGQLAVRARARLQRHVRQPRDLRQRALEAPHQLQRALRVLGVLERVQAGVPGQRRHPLVQLRVVLHRARAERVEALVEVEVLRRQRHVVAHQLGLGDLGQLGGPLARSATPGSSSRHRHLGHVGCGRRERAPARAASARRS